MWDFFLFCFVINFKANAGEKYIPEESQFSQNSTTQITICLTNWICLHISIVLHQWDQLYMHHDFLFNIKKYVQFSGNIKYLMNAWDCLVDVPQFCVNF